MLNRRYLRIKVLQALYSFFHDDDKNLKNREKELLKSIDNIYGLYIYLLLLFKEIRTLADRLLEERKKKRLPTAEELNPNRKFIDGPLLLKLAASPVLAKGKSDYKVAWTSEEDGLIKELYNVVTNSAEYANYMADTDNSYEKEAKFLATVYKKHLSENESLKHHLFEKNIHWASDYMLANICMVKTMESAQEGEDVPIMPLYKADDDRDFMLELFNKTILSDTDNIKLIGDKISNWEPDRVATMDFILMKMAITEVMNFPGIPVKVTLNEYIEISKLFSSPKSNTFINGILDAIVKDLKKQNKVVKAGRGLIE
jgi:N utilization substance protein B